MQEDPRLALVRAEIEKLKRIKKEILHPITVSFDGDQTVLEAPGDSTENRKGWPVATYEELHLAALNRIDGMIGVLEEIEQDLVHIASSDGA